MPDDNTDTTGGQGDPGPSGSQPEPPQPEATPTRSADDDLGDTGKRALDREREARREAERKFKELSEKHEKVDVEALRRERDAADEKATRLEVEAMRYRIGLKAGVPVDHLDRLRGETEEDIRTDAEQYAKTLGQQAGGLGGGARGTEAPKDMNTLIRTAAGRGSAQ